MKSMMTVCALLALSAPAAFAQQQQGNQQQANQSSREQQRMNMERAQSHAVDEWRRMDEQRSVNSIAALSRLRAMLAESWQTMGLPSESAKLIAAAYRPERSGRADHLSLDGKSDEEVSGMMQDALAKKNYLLADQLLIKFQQARLVHGQSTAPDGIR